MTYVVKEIFKTCQGEGGQAGRTSVFCRFTGATSGVVATRIGRRLSAVFAIPTLSVSMEKVAVGLSRPTIWLIPFVTRGARVPATLRGVHRLRTAAPTGYRLARGRPPPGGAASPSRTTGHFRRRLASTGFA